jgi:hypothetical protein
MDELYTKRVKDRWLLYRLLCPPYINTSMRSIFFLFLFVLDWSMVPNNWREADVAGIVTISIRSKKRVDLPIYAGYTPDV